MTESDAPYVASCSNAPAPFAAHSDASNVGGKCIDHEVHHQEAALLVDIGRPLKKVMLGFHHFTS